ncbi:hypothetical protein KSY44_05050 [Bacteroides eggerthii]|jgi:hypothetical protein|uniref:hypothetical protein n=1 Tax=Bacteroides eggerthii TaxID=28111 RepID=UPI001C37685C|nr:hypothetical protein [Bacteroides eggerthii]MBV3843244.1 hypothetical protein [Bacteroides eggerthii]MBV3846573.1 hypothetical protein [Bacteroides eggerthii]MBV3884339.1 hypothetical protein [Bacteroides eggerthii]MBV3891288.1 hypothetical protein [Bacteroides eggerthii]MBV3902449.1 hypothetical protein [Bacteroides eggerthii]
MKLNKYFMLGLAGLAFAACSNEDEVGNDLSQNSKTITVKIETGGYTTRASGNEAWTNGANNQSQITVNTVTLYLLDKDGAIVDTKILENKSSDTFHGVSGTVTKIAAVANCQPTASGTWANVVAETFDVADYQTAENAPVYAEAVDITYKNTDTQEGYPMYEATLQLATKMSRIELSGNLQCTNLAESAYKTLTLEYVGINGANTKFTLDGTGSDPHSVTDNLPGFPDTGTPTAFYDAAAAPAPVLSNKNTSVALGTSYGYSVCGMPELLLRFDSEPIDNVTEGYIIYDPAYLKITGFKTAGGNTVAMEPGKIYQITDLEFTEEDITTLEKDKICITATVSVAPWDIVAVEPSYGE